MKHLTLKNIGSSLVLVTGMTVYGLASGQGDKPSDATPAAPQAAAGAKAEQPIPATVDGIWQAIDQKTAELQKTIQGGALNDVHHLAFAVRDLVAALPERSKSLSADQQAKVKSNVKFVATLADRLDASGDANDKAASQANYDKLMKVLQSLRANYPASPTR